MVSGKGRGVKVRKILFVFLFLFTVVYSQEKPSKFSVDKIADGFRFVEGPVWKEGRLLFSDIPANIIYQWSIESGISEFLNPSGNSNGLALDINGNLLIPQHGKRRLVRLEKDGCETVLASHYNGKRLNSPNDIHVQSDGSIFFTDPPYGIQSDQEELGFYGIYKISLSGDLYLLDKSLNRPNGIALSPDELKLYVTDSQARKIFTWDIVDDSTITNKQEFLFMDAKGNTDGMKFGKDGLLYSTGPLGIWVINQKGIVIDTIKVPGQTTNCNWGGSDGNTLFVTSGDAVYEVTRKKPK